MKLVTFSAEMKPHGVGDTRLVSDAVAADLEKQGVISSSEPWPAKAAAPAAAVAQKPQRAVLKPARPSGVSDKRIAE